MKSLISVGFFALLMTVVFAGQSTSLVSFVSPTYASDDSGNDDANKDESDGGESSSDSDSDSDKDSSDNDSNAVTVAFSCPEGVSTCYRADGSEYLDINNLEATAAGDDEDGDKDAMVKAVNPRHFRSF